MDEAGPFPSPVDEPTFPERLDASMERNADILDKLADAPIGDISSVAKEAEIQAEADTEEKDPLDLLTDLHTWITSGMDICEAVLQTDPSRELHITLMKLEEAEMWLIKLYPTEEVN